MSGQAKPGMSIKEYVDQLEATLDAIREWAEDDTPDQGFFRAQQEVLFLLNRSDTDDY